MGLGADSQVHICLGDAPAVSEAGLVSAPLSSSGRRCAAPLDSDDGRDAGGDAGSSGSGAEHPAPPSAGSSIEEPPGSPLLLSGPCLYSACVRAYFGFHFLSQSVCPRLGISETTEKPTPMQTHEGLFTSSSLCPSTPDITEQGLGP